MSPFLGMDLTYRLSYTAPGEDLAVAFAVIGPDGPELQAGMWPRRRAATRRSIAQVLWSPQGGTIGVSTGIYRHALALRHRGVPVHPRPCSTRR